MDAGDAVSFVEMARWGAPLLLGGISGALVTWAKMAKYQQKVDDLKEDKNEICRKLEALRSDVDTLKEFRVNAQKFIDKSLYEARSPLQLSDLGRKMVEESGFMEIFETCKDDLVQRLEALAPQTKYDAQEKARAVMDEMTGYPPFRPIKTYAYNNGLDFAQILRAGAIILRDYYFDLHPEIRD